MTIFIQLHYINERLQLGMVDVKTVYSLLDTSRPLLPEVYRGKLIYRVRGSSKRISYDQLKKGLVRKSVTIRQEASDWLSIPKKK